MMITLITFHGGYPMTVKLNCIIFAISALVGIAMRSLMVFFTIDPASGFVMQEYFLPNLFITILLGIACIAGFATALLIKTHIPLEVKLNNLPLSLSLTWVALGIGYETFFSDILINVSGFQIAVHSVLTLLSIAALVFIAVCKLTNMPYQPIISLVPVAFWVMRLIIVFTGFSTISTISDTIIETATMCLTLAVFLFYAKIECYQSTKNYKLFFATALACSTVSLVASVPRAIILIPAKICEALLKLFPDAAFPNTLGQFAEQNLHPSAVPCTTGIFVAIFSTIFAYSLISKIKD